MEYSYPNWPAILIDPSRVRMSKPRKHGITMMIDKGIGISSFQDLLNAANEYIDYIKLGFGTCVLYPVDILKRKIEIAKQYNVKIYPGGTLLEAAIEHNQENQYFSILKKMGFKTVEISDGTIDISKQKRKELVERAINLELEVITEYGKKLSGDYIDFGKLEDTLSSDIESGASYVIVEGRESGKGVGIYDQNGDFETSQLVDFVHQWPFSQLMIWEAPLKKQQIEFIKLFGSNVNLGNIAAEEVISLEALRRGLRSDTFTYASSLSERK